MLIEYDKSPRISPEQRIQSLADSVMRAMEELEGSIGKVENLETQPLEFKKPEQVETLNSGDALGDLMGKTAKNLEVLNQHTHESFDNDVKFNKNVTVSGNLFIELDDETLALWEEVFGTSGGGSTST